MRRKDEVLEDRGEGEKSGLRLGTPGDNLLIPL